MSMQRLEVEDSDREDLLYQTGSHQGGGESSSNSRKNRGEGCWIYSILAFLAFILFVFLMIDIASSGGGNSDDDNGISDDGDAPYFVSSYGGVVATDDERCSQMGVDVLNRGGNAVDAAIVALLCEDIANPASSGVGGGFLMTIYSNQSQNGSFIDAREFAPLAASTHMFDDEPTDARDGPLAVAVPGFLKGIDKASSQFGALDFSDLFDEVIEMAEYSELNHFTATAIEENSDYCSNYPDLSNIYCQDSSSPKNEGDSIIRPTFKSTLEALKNNGSSDIFYFGEIGQNLVSDLDGLGGIIDFEDDLGVYDVKIRELIEEEMFGFHFLLPPPPSSGGLTISSIIKFLEGYDEPLPGTSSLYYHRLSEAMKHGFALRMNLGDPDFDNLTEISSYMRNSSFLEGLREETLDYSTIDLVRYGGKFNQLDESGYSSYYSSSYYSSSHDTFSSSHSHSSPSSSQSSYQQSKDSKFFHKSKSNNLRSHSTSSHLTSIWKEDGGTSHISVIDKDHMCVSVTSTINTYFGSKVLSPSTGILLNNQMDDFSLPNTTNSYGLAPFEANFIQVREIESVEDFYFFLISFFHVRDELPHKRPLSSMSPSIILQFSQQFGHYLPRLVAGSSGGPHIITSTLEAILNVLVFGMNVEEAILSPRIHHQLIPNHVDTEFDYVDDGGFYILLPDKDIYYLRNHSQFTNLSSSLGRVQMVEMDIFSHIHYGASDIRKGGKPKRQ